LTQPQGRLIGHPESAAGLTTNTHLVCDGAGRALAFVVAAGQVADTVMLRPVLDQIRVPGPG
jgi:hypothetical protein